MTVMHQRKVLIRLTHLSHPDFLTTLDGLAAAASTDGKTENHRSKEINQQD